MTGHYDEEIHGLDYLVYAYLQKGDNDSAISLLHYLETDLKGFPANFKVAYAYAAIPSRIVLENKNWKAAANLLVKPVNFPWKDFPWPEGIIHFTRGLGALHIGDKVAAENELQKLQELQTVLEKQKDAYKSKQLEVQAKSIQAWLLFKNNRNDDAIALMRKAADMEDSSGKHPVTPGEVIPARELLADLLMEMNKPSEALLEYEKALQKTPNKKNLLKGAALAAAKIN